MALIAKLELAGYFLIVWDIVQFCSREGILVQGRGSAANSVVCYALGITAIDPVGMDLLFERFLSEERGEWPDIDLDLPSGDQRERAIQYVYQRYGELGAAMTANVITYRGRSAAREAGKALGFDAETLNRLTKLVSAWEWRDKDDSLGRNFHDAGFDIQHRRIAKYVELCQRMQDLPRHLGQHSGGMVICGGQLNAVVPIEPASMPGRTVIQWDKEDCADMKIIKVDLLGLGMMAVLKDCLDAGARSLPRAARSRAASAKRSANLSRPATRRHRGHVPGGEPRPDGGTAAQSSNLLLRSRGAGGHHPSRSHRRQHDESLHEAAARPRVGDLLSSAAGAGAASARSGIPLFQEQLIRMAMIVANFTRRRG